MTNDLTDADLAYLFIALRKVQGPTARINKRDQIAFAYGLAAGRERAIEEAAALLLRMRPFSALGDAAAIRSLKGHPLNAPAAP